MTHLRAIETLRTVNIVSFRRFLAVSSRSLKGFSVSDRKSWTRLSNTWSQTSGDTLKLSSDSATSVHSVIFAISGDLVIVRRLTTILAIRSSRTIAKMTNAINVPATRYGNPVKTVIRNMASLIEEIVSYRPKNIITYRFLID